MHLTQVVAFGFTAALGSPCLGCTGELAFHAGFEQNDGRSARVDDGDGVIGRGEDGLDVSTIPPSSAIPRLSRRELESIVQSVLGVEQVAFDSLPPEQRTSHHPQTGGPEEIYDTMNGPVGAFVPSEVLVQGVANMASSVAERAAQDTVRLEQMAGCAPQGQVDPVCMRSLVEVLGERLFRRPLEGREIERLTSLAAEFSAEGGFYLGVRVVIQSLLSAPDFFYKPELGHTVGAQTQRLDNHSLLAKMSFLLWGQGPSAELLAQASGPEFSAEQVRALAIEMIDDPRSIAQVKRMHAMWLRFGDLLVNEPALRADMLRESNALLDRVLGDAGLPWSSLFTLSETYVTPALAAHYGMEDNLSEPAWVEYSNPERAGILSHGSFLSLSATRGRETLPSRRGAMILSRILCSVIPPPPADVDIDDGVAVEPGTCKADAYKAHRESGSGCVGCHTSIDPIGFGFERFDGQGAYRSTENDNAACTIDGRGEALGTPFSGPRQFVQAVHQASGLTRCGAEQLLRFGLRRRLEASDQPLLERLSESFARHEDFRLLLIALTTDPSFRHRREDSP